MGPQRLVTFVISALEMFLLTYLLTYLTERYRPSTVRYREICLFMFISRGFLNRLSLFLTQLKKQTKCTGHVFRKPKLGREIVWSSLSPLFPFLSLTFTSLPLFPFLSSLRSRTLEIQLGGLRSAVSSPPGLRQSPSRNRIWCILALKCDIWWHQF